MPTRAALEIAANRDLDLVKVQGNATPPVCKLMDFGKFRFEQSKKEKEFKKNSKVGETKELWLTPGTGEHDFETKLKIGRTFLVKGDKLKVTVKFKGRQMAHQDLGHNLLKKFADACADIAVVSDNGKMDNRRLSMLLMPKASNRAEQSTTNNVQKKGE